MKENYPERINTHIIDDNGQLILKSILPSEWFVQFQQSREYGTDLEVEIPIEKLMKANLFKGQLKSHTSVKINKDDTISQFIYYKNWNYWQRQPTPFFLFVADLSNKKVYWLNVKTANIEYKQIHKSEPYNITIIGKNGKINCYDKDFIQLLLKTKFNEVIGIDEPKLKELITHLPLNRKIIFNYKAKIIKIYKNVRINL